MDDTQEALRLFLRDTMQEGTPNEQAVARTAMRLLAAAAPAPAGEPVAGWKMLKDSGFDERSWPEDYDSENCYSCECHHCLRQFLGHKRRVTCKVCAATPPAPAGTPSEPVEMSPEFTDTARDALLWVLWHHHGGGSPIGQPIRFALGMGAHDRLSAHQIERAKRWAALTKSETADFRREARGFPSYAGTPSEDALDAARYRWLRSQHEVDDERASDNNYGKSYPPRTMTVFVDDGHDGLDPLPCDPGALDAAIDAALSAQEHKHG